MAPQIAVHQPRQDGKPVCIFEYIKSPEWNHPYLKISPGNGTLPKELTIMSLLT